MALLLVVTGTILLAYESTQRSEAFVRGRTATLDEMRITMNRMTKDARQASAVDTSSTGSRLEMDTYILGEPATVVYAVAGTALTRQVGNEPATVLQENLASPAIFGYVPSVAATEVVTMTMLVHPPDQPDTTVSLTSEARLRNRRAQ